MTFAVHPPLGFFDLQGSGAAGVPDGGAADAVARLSAMLASAAALVDTEDSLTPAQRHSCGLDAASAGPAAAGAGLPFGVAAPLQQQQQQQQNAASMGAAARWQQQAAAFFPSPAPAPQPVPQQLGAGISQQGMPAGLAGWPMQLPNGQQQQPVMQQAPSHQFAQLQPAAQQWQTPAQHGMQPFGMAMQQQQQQQLGGAPLMPGVSGIVRVVGRAQPRPHAGLPVIADAGSECAALLPLRKGPCSLCTAAHPAPPTGQPRAGGPIRGDASAKAGGRAARKWRPGRHAVTPAGPLRACGACVHACALSVETCCECGASGVVRT